MASLLLPGVCQVTISDDAAVKHCLESDVQLLSDACKQIELGYKLSLQILIVQMNHNTRY